MTKIETYKEATTIAERLARDAHRCLGRDGTHNDKHCAKAEFQDIENTRSRRMLICISLGYGQYGSSAVYSIASYSMGRYMAQAITKQMPALLDAVVAMALADAEAARKDAEDEAHAVLQDSAHDRFQLERTQA